MENIKRKFINNISPTECGQICVARQTFTLIQENDTFGDQDKYQQLNIETVGVGYDERENRDFFFRVSTGGEADEPDIEPFWAVEGPEELVDIFNEIAKRTDINVRWELKKLYLNENEGTKSDPDNKA